MDDLSMITIKKTALDQRSLVIKKNDCNNMSSSTSLPDIQIQLETVDGDPFNISPNQVPISPNNSDRDDIDVFNFTYYGHISIDKRTVPSVFPWIAKRIIKHAQNSKDIYANISKTKLWVTERDNKDYPFQEYSFDSIYRLSRMTKDHMDEYLAYIICSKIDGSNAVFHLMKCNDQKEKHEFLNTLKTRVLGFQKVKPTTSESKTAALSPQRPTHKRGASSGAILVSPVKKDSEYQDSVFYIGKVNLSQQKAPPQFIDKVLIHLNKMSSNDASQPPTKSSLLKKRFSLDAGSPSASPTPEIKVFPQPTGRKPPLTRKRSASVDSDKYNPHQVNLKNPPQLPQIDVSVNNSAAVFDEYDGSSLALNSINEDVKSRLITLQISKTSLSLYSVGSKKMLFEKKIQSISFCTKGDLRRDHFGFICREGANHICYILQGESEQKVDAIMKALKTAFAEALQASANSTLCELCPIQSLHKLCTNLEGVNTIGEKDVMVHETIKILSDYEQLHVLNEVNEEDPESDNERIEITVNVLRELFDDKQKAHKHSHNKLQPTMDQEPRDRLNSSANSTIFEKAKKSLTTSFQNFSIKKVRSRTFSPLVFDSDNKRPIGVKPYQNGNGIETKPRSKSLETNFDTPEFKQNGAKLELNLDQVYPRRSIRTSSIEKVEKNIPKSVKEEKDDFEEIKKTSPKIRAHRPLRRESSWRQQIYQSVVVTGSREGSSSSIVTIAGDSDDEQNVDIGARARSRWQNAIRNQILLIRMEKENKKLAANISATEIRRQKLSYQDLSTFTAEAASAWDELITLKSNEKIEKHFLLENVRGGIPRARRGEIWQYLIKQHTISRPSSSDSQCWKETPYRTLLKKSSGHQHAILIDLGRTFPQHAHFVPRLGTGQISLFNILTAYSQLDDEVGYCQGLSFVVGILLMHMPDEDAFKCFCHLMFDLQIRDQYKPDMNAVQQELYQLSRLLHDYHPKVYEHFIKYDVTPTLYAAPWFLTLYASQYPIGFVSRVMDMVLLEGMEVIFKVALVLIGNHAEEILSRESFESIVDYMKLDLPNKVITETDDISSRALNMDITQQLNLYEVEYQLLNEESIDIRQNKEKFEKQEAAFEEVKQEMIDLKNELVESQNSVKALQTSLDEANSRNEEYEQKLRALIQENQTLKGSSVTQTDDLTKIDSNKENGFPIENWNLVPSPPTQREMKCLQARAMSLDSGSMSLLSSEENISCELLDL